MSKRRVRRYFLAILLGAVVVMAVLGSNSNGLRANPSKFMLYWLLVGVLLLWVVVLVLMDVLAIRKDFLSSRRTIFRNTIGDPELLRKLRDAQRRNDDHRDEEEEQQ